MRKRKDKYVSGKYDPFELNSIWFDERSALRGLVPNNQHICSPFMFFLMGFYHLVRLIGRTIIITPSTLFLGFYRRWRKFDNKLIFFVPTNNNQKAVSLIANTLKENKKDFVVIDKAFDPRIYTMVRICLFSMLFLYWLTKRYMKCNDSDKRVVLYNLSFMLLTPGVTWFYMEMLKKCKPECIVFANDHMPYCKSLELICEDFGIRTIYVQHASVSSAFPELHFTYSFLDGMDSLLKYTELGKNSVSNMILLGALRYDALSLYRVKRSAFCRNCIGIAINDLDDNTIVNDFCNRIIGRYPEVNLRVRSHPALLNRPFVFDCTKKIIYKCATEESITDYLNNIDIQISGDSGVHFDAIIGGVPTFLYNFTNKPFEDNYGYVKSGLVKYSKTIEETYELIDQGELDAPTSIVSYFDASYGKQYAGNCSKIVSDFILNNYNLDYLCDTYGMGKSEVGGKEYYIFPR